MYDRFGVHIDFAYRTFRWDSEASIKAHVHCVIVGFSVAPNTTSKRLFINGRMLALIISMHISLMLMTCLLRVVQNLFVPCQI